MKPQVISLVKEEGMAGVKQAISHSGGIDQFVLATTAGNSIGPQWLHVFAVVTG